MSLVVTGAEVLQVVNMDLALEAAEEAFRAYGEGRVNMPPKSYLQLPKGDFRAMYGALSGEYEVCGCKWVNVHPENPQRGLPTVMAKIILNDPDTALEIADLDGTYITNYRTGAAGGLAARYLARADAVSLGVIGAGVQARMQIFATLRTRPINRITIYNRTLSRAEALQDDIISRCGLAVEVTTDPEAAVRDHDIIVTTTPANEPLVQSDWISPGTHINAIGADAAGKQELDPAILRRARIIVDDWGQARHSGEINVALSQGLLSPEQIHGSLGDVVAGKISGRQSDTEITVFDSTGLIIQDLALGFAVYKGAKERGLGEDKEFIPGLPAGA